MLEIKSSKMVLGMKNLQLVVAISLAKQNVLTYLRSAISRAKTQRVLRPEKKAIALLMLTCIGIKK
jgi:hypothetical protein